MKKVLLLHPPMDLGYSVLTPLGLAAIHAATPPGYRPEVRDLTQKRWTDLSWSDFAPYDVIGISVRYTYNSLKIKTFLRALRQRRPDATLIAGGEHATWDLAGMFSCGLDYVVRFKGENTWTELLGALREGRPPAEVAGLAWRQADRFQTNPDRPFLDPNSLPIPSFHLFNPRDYPFAMDKRAASLEASRGCPNSCRFCTNPSIWRGRWAPKTVPRIVEEVDRVQALGFNFLFFADDNFGIDLEHLLDLFSALARRKEKILFSAAMQPRTIARAPHLLGPAWEAGLRLLTLDTNTIDQGSNEQLNRGETRETIHQALTAVRASPIAAVSNVMVGTPGESEEQMRRNIRFTRKHADVLAIGTLEPRPGNRFWQDSDYERADMLGKGEPLLHDNPAMVRRLIRLSLLAYYFHPATLGRALFSPKLGTRLVIRLMFRLYANAARGIFLRRQRTAHPGRIRG